MWNWPERKKRHGPMDKKTLELVLKYSMILCKLQELEEKISPTRISDVRLLIWEIRSRIQALQDEVREDYVKPENYEYSRN
jgi:hypothetical protein